MEITVILPCAGEGSRLGLKIPKELFEVLPGTRLIDFSLDHIRAFADKKKIKVAVVVRPWKTETAEYVARNLPGISVKAVMFNESYSEWPGSVYSVSDLSENNLVLLPDSCLRLSEGPSCGDVTCFDGKGKTLVELVLEALREYGVVFGSVQNTDPHILKHLGAMKVEGGGIIAFQDKPSQHLELYNSFWGCYAFRGIHARALYDFLIQSVRHQPVSLQEQPFYPVGAVPLHSYRDLGTWERIDLFRRELSHKG